MDRRAFVAGLGAVLATPLGVEAQQRERAGGQGVTRIGVACNNYVSHPRADEPQGAFLQELGRLGYEIGKNVIVDIRGTTGDHFSEIIAELVRAPVEILVVSPTAAALAAKAANLSIPVVFTVVAEPVELGLVSALARPGGNLTGVVNVTADLAAKRLETLKQIVPRVSRIAVALDPVYPITAGLWKSSLEASHKLNVKLDPVDVRTAPGLTAAWNTMWTNRPEAGLVLPSIPTLDHASEIAEFCLRNRLPTMFSFPDRDVQVGGLVAYGANYHDQWRQAAVYVDKILKGASPADLPVQQPTNFELTINLKTAKTLGLTIPPSLLLRADQVTVTVSSLGIRAVLPAPVGVDRHNVRALAARVDAIVLPADECDHLRCPNLQTVEEERDADR